MHAAHVKLETLVEEILKVENLFGVIEGCEHSVMITAAERQLLASDMVNADFVVRLTW